MACSVQFSLCSMKCACADSGAFAGAGAVRYVHCAVCRVQCAAYQRWRLSSWNKMSQIKMLSLKLTFQKPIAPLYFLGHRKCEMRNKI